MLRIVFLLAALTLFALPVEAEEKKAPMKPTVELSGDIADRALEKEAPESGVIVSEQGWEKLVKAWGIKDAPKVDFTKELLMVGTWKGSGFTLRHEVKAGNLTVHGFGLQNIAPGFRWRVETISRDGVKTVNGKELPKE